MRRFSSRLARKKSAERHVARAKALNIIDERRLWRTSKVAKWALSRAMGSQWGWAEDAVVLAYRSNISPIRLKVCKPGMVSYSPMDASRVYFGDDRLVKYWQRFPNCLSCSFGESWLFRVPKEMYNDGTETYPGKSELFEEALNCSDPIAVYHALRAPIEFPKDL